MLYGCVEMQQDILAQANKYAENHDMKLVFGAMVGSISKGLHYADSDYDTRFLFLRKDFPSSICIPSEMTEQELVKRFYPKDKIYEWIPFWEMTSFLQFLREPSFLNDFSLGLYNIVGWTFMSPYIWDPYGLQNKIVPLMNQIFNMNYEIGYHKGIIQKYINELHNETIITKSYLYSLHAAATIQWSQKYNTQPPIDLQTLLYGVGERKMWEIAEEMLSKARSLARKKSRDSITLHSSHFEIKTSYVSEVTEYIEYNYQKAIEIEGKNPQYVSNNMMPIIDDMYKIVEHSIKSEKLLYQSGY